MSTSEVLVVGGGIAGSAAAGVLVRSGCDVVVADDGPEMVGGFAMALMPNGTRALRTLGLEQAAGAAGMVVTQLCYRNQRDELLNCFELATSSESDPWLLIRWQALRAVLVEMCPGVERLSAVVGLEESADSVKVSFEDGSERSFAYVVIADGAGSRLRDGVDPDPTVTRLSHIWRWFCDDGQTDRPWGIWLGERSTFMAFPVGDGQMLCQGVVPALPDHDPVEGRSARVRERFAAYHGTPSAYVSELGGDTDIAAHTITDVRLRSWHTDRLLVIGDAAHSASSASRQGASMALEDAVVLGELLESEPLGATTFNFFERRRRPRVEPVQDMGRAFDERAAHAEGDVLLIRDAILREQTDEDFNAGWQALITNPP